MSHRRTLTLLALTGALMATTTPALAAPPTRSPSRIIEAFARYEPQRICSPTAKPGTAALRRLVLRTYGGTGDYGIVRNCKIGGRSEHKEGRAWDWKVNVNNRAQVRKVNDFMTFALRTDKYGNQAAMARRLGIMYMIWNKRIWSAHSNKWRRYTGANPHTNHVHISLGWNGAMKRTSYWTGKVAKGTATPPPRVYRPPVPPVYAPTPPVWSPDPVPTPPTTPTTVPTDYLTAPATLSVPAASASGVQTTFKLVAGKRYLLKAVGTYEYGPVDMVADAECSVRENRSWDRRSAWEDDGSWTGPRGHLDLRVAGQSTRWNTLNGVECDSSSHTYVTVIQPSTTGTLTLKITDDIYEDNNGALAVTVTPLGSSYYGA